MPVQDAPTSPRGSLGLPTYPNGWGVPVDPFEHVTDLTWPLSIQTYAKMRHDPTLTSVVAAYRLPIMRARWEIDPRGASARMVKACADSLGLPVRGKPDKPGPARRRGVQWIDHLRLALGSLVFGHAIFEPVYDVSTGRALLASLAERPQLSVAAMNVDRQGDLVSVTQWGDVTEPNPPEIPADRLLWYCRDREAGNWAGQSILRASFAPWLLKQDALRVQATSHRRFGAGIPVAEALPGTNPTQTQMAAAQAIAEQVRAGDTSGATMPPGFRLRVLGVEGTFPDGLPTIRYHDEQMARSALASMLDLGSTPNGSRALGDTFADLLAMAQQGVAESIAEQATMLCVRLTDFNEGDQANAPAVVVGDVASSRQVIAESISELVRAGAIVLDDELEDWIREAFDAPAKAARAPQPAPVQPPPGQPVDGEDPADQGTDPQPGDQTDPNDPPAGTKPKGERVTAAAGDPPVPARTLTEQEQAAGLDPEQVDAARDTVLAALLLAWASIGDDHRQQLRDRIAAIVETGQRTALASLTIDTSAAADVLLVALTDAYTAGAALAVAEAAVQGVTLTAPAAADAALADTASAIAAVLAASTSAAAGREALRLVGLPGAGVVDAAAVADQVAAYLAGLSDAWLTGQLGAAVETGIGAGRADVMARGPVSTLFASEIRDTATCEPCAEIDGTVFDSWDSALAAYPTATQYRACLGTFRCRGLLVALYDDGGIR